MEPQMMYHLALAYSRERQEAREGRQQRYAPHLRDAALARRRTRDDARPRWRWSRRPVSQAVPDAA